MTERETIYEIAFAKAESLLRDHRLRYRTNEGMAYEVILKAMEKSGEIKVGPTEDDKKRLRSVIEGLDTAMARQTHGDIILNAFKWTTTELEKSWGMK